VYDLKGYGDTLYLLHSEGVQRYSISSLAFLGDYLPFETEMFLGVSRMIIYDRESFGPLLLFSQIFGTKLNFYDPINNENVHTFDTGSQCYVFEISGDFLFLSCASGGIQIWDISNPQNPVEIQFWGITHETSVLKSIPMSSNLFAGFPFGGVGVLEIAGPNFTGPIGLKAVVPTFGSRVYALIPLENQTMLMIATEYGLEIHNSCFPVPPLPGTSAVMTIGTTENAQTSESPSANSSLFIIIGATAGGGILLIIIGAFIIGYAISKRKKRQPEAVPLEVQSTIPAASATSPSPSGQYTHLNPEKTTSTYSPILLRPEDKKSPAVTASTEHKRSQIKYEELTILDPLGGGAFGAVYKYNSFFFFCILSAHIILKLLFFGPIRGEWRRMSVAIKLIKMERTDPLQIQGFIEEAEIMKNMMPHQNVVQFLGFCTNPICIVT
jgi:hypothetical protein